jgi:hypothetical protein
MRERALVAWWLLLRRTPIAAVTCRNPTHARSSPALPSHPPPPAGRRGDSPHGQCVHGLQARLALTVIRNDTCFLNLQEALGRAKPPDDPTNGCSLPLDHTLHKLETLERGAATNPDKPSMLSEANLLASRR